MTVLLHNKALKSITSDFEGITNADYANVKPLEGWYTDNSGGTIEVGKASTYGLNSDNFVIELEQNKGDVGNLYTFIESTVNEPVKINFDYSPRAGHEGKDSDIQILVDGKVIATIFEQNVGFKPFTFSVPGTGETMRVEFKALGSNSYGGLLDNISIGEKSVAINPINLIENGSFEDVTGTVARNYGFKAHHAIKGWTTDKSQDSQIDIHNDSRGGMVATDGKNWLDMEGSGNIRIGQDVKGVVNGTTYQLSFDVSDSKFKTAIDGPVENTVKVYWGGVLIKTIDPSNVGESNFERIELTLIGGAGNGNNRLEFEGQGKQDAEGVAIDNVKLYAVDMPEQAPIAVDDQIIAQQDNAITITPAELLKNDYDPDGDKISIISVQNAQNGNVVFENGVIVFTPDAGYTGPAQFDYTISDRGVNNAPLLTNQTQVADNGLTYYSDSNGCIGTLNVETGERTFIGNPNIQFFDIAMNKADQLFGISSSNQLYSINTSTGAAKLIGHAGWGINALTSGPDGQLYGVGNGQVYSISEKTGQATKIDCPDIRSAGDVVYADGLLYITTTKDQLVTYNLETKETQVLVNNLPGVSTYGISLTADGLIAGVTTNNELYQVNPLDGKVIFTGVKSDGPTVFGLASAQTELMSPVDPKPASGLTDTATVNIDIVPPENRAPEAVDDMIVSNQDGQIVISPSQLLGNDSDPDGDVLQGISVQDAVNGTVTFDGMNVIFTPTEGYAGPASFTYTISDGKGGFDTAKVDLVVDGRVTPDAPKSAPDMTVSTDTGVSDSDDLTKDTTPNFAVQVPVGHTPNLYIDGEKVASTYDPVTKTLTPIQPLEEGPHAVSYTLTSPQGKESGLSPNLPILIDATAPQTPVNAPDMTPETDTGIKNDDDDTDNRTPSFKVGEIGDNSPALYVDGVKVPATYDAANGTLTPNTPIADGPHEVTYTLTDAAGNESMPSPKLPIVIGSQNQAPEAVDDMIAVNYVGPVEIDISTLLSNDIDVDGDQLQGVSVQDAQNGSVEVQGDKLIFTPESGFEGVASFTYTVSDGKGGVDTATVNLNINISAPDAPVNAPDMTAATDTGISDTDDLTKLEMPDFAIANPGDHIVTLYIDGTPYPAEYNPAKGVITPIAALEDGQYQISYTLKDPVTGKESAMSPVLLIEVDNDIYQPLTPVDMTDETDTGISNTDNITSDATPDFAVEVPDNSTPSLIVDGVKVEAIYDADKGTLTPKSPLVDGPHEVSYSLMDAAGNESAPSPALTVVIGEVNQNQNLIMNGSFEDVTGLEETFYGFAGQGEVPYWTDSKGLTIDIHNDQRDGVKPTDGTNWADLGGLNSDNRIGQNVSGVVAGQSYKLEFDAGDIRTADDGKAGDNLVTVYWGGEAIATINPPDGSMSHYEFNLIGGAGNGSNRLEFAGSGKLDNFGVSIDKISLVSQANTTLTAADMTAQTDSGNSDTDNLTNVGTPGFVIEASDGRTPILYVDGKPVETTFDVDTSTVTPVNPLPEGPHQISYKLVDGLGNESPLSQPLNIMIDTQAPQISGVADMIDASDDGVSNQDDITTETKPSFAIEPAGENIPSLYVDGVKVPASYDAKNGTLTPVEPLSLGNHAISYSLTDPAGNESAPSLPLPIEIKAAFDVPQENKAPDAQDDVIVGEQDHAITISPSELLGNDSDPDGDSLQGVSLQDPVNGTVYFDGQNVIFTPTAGYSGPASFTYTITDGKGGFDTATVNLVVDAIAAPATPSSPLDMTAETDTGVSNTDNITGDTTPSFTIENLGINTPNLYVDGVKVASNFAFGVLTPVDPIAVGYHEVTYTLTNPAGKESAQSPALPIEIQVVSVNSNPNAGDDDIAAQSGVVVIAPSELLANDVDENGDTLQGVSLQDAVNGTVSFDGQNVIFTPTDGYTGPASFTYTVTDGKGGFDTATVNLTIASPSKEGIIDFNDYQPNVNSALPAGWFTDNPGGMIEVLPSDVYGIPGEVTNVLELERYKGDASNFYTFVNSKAGETITLDFDYSARSSATWSEHSNSLTASGANTTSAVHILVNGAIFQTIDTNVVGFTHFSLAIPGTGDTMRIEFQAADKNEVGGLIDNIDLSATPIYLNGQPEGVQTPVMPDVPVVEDQTQHQPSNGGVKITVEGSDGDTHLQGTAGNDVINGGATTDFIQGGAGNDVIYGHAGNDVISGGAGNDKMDGGVGADTFTWSLADTQGAGVEVDTVYNLQQNDAIDLKDLLNGETHDAQSLVNYLHFSVDGDKTTMYVSADGKFSEGNVDLANTTQQIEFVGVDLTAGGSMNDMQVIQSLLANHQLITD